MKKLIKKIVRRIKNAGRPIVPKHDPEGKAFYDPAKTMTFQGYFDRNKEAIFKGDVPKRYVFIDDLIPGERLLEIGSADGTQSLLAARSRKAVHGVELMPDQYNIAEELKSAWQDLGLVGDNCTFHNASALEAGHLLNEVDTVVMSRVIYHLRHEVFEFFEMIQNSPVKHLVMVGCPRREARWEKGGDTGDAMGKYAYYASSKGMKEIAIDHGFEVVNAIPSGPEQDPIVVASR